MGTTKASTTTTKNYQTNSLTSMIRKTKKNKSIGNPLIAGNVLNLINLMHFLKKIKIHKKNKKYKKPKNNCLNFVNIQIYSIDVFVQNSILQLTSPFLIGVKYFNQRNFSLV